MSTIGVAPNLPGPLRSDVRAPSRGTVADPVTPRSRPRVSVVMPVYNGMPYLPLAIDSVLAQTFRDFELIIINDASADATAEILAVYAIKDVRIRTLMNQRNCGVATSLNAGLDAARGELIAIMHADDICLSERLRRQVEFLDLHPDHVLVGTHFQIVDSAGRVRKNVTVPSEFWELEWFAHFFTPVCHSTAMFRAWLAQKEGLRYDDKYRATEDTDFWLRALRYGKMANLRESLVQYRVHTRNISTRLSEVQNGEAREIFLDNVIKGYPQIIAERDQVRQLYDLIIFARRSEDSHVAQAAEAMLRIESNFLRTRDLSAQQRLRIHRLAARWLVWAVIRTGSLVNIAKLFWQARYYRLDFMCELLNAVLRHATDYASRQLTLILRQSPRMRKRV